MGLNMKKEQMIRIKAYMVQIIAHENLSDIEKMEKVERFIDKIAEEQNPKLHIKTGDLRRCPFCDSKAELHDNRLSWFVRCSNKECRCTVTGKTAPEPNSDKSDEYWKQFEESAINRWNREAK